MASVAPETRGFRARLRLLETAEGGRRRAASSSSYSPQLRLGSISTSVRIVKLDGDGTASHDDLIPGESYDVFIVVPFVDYYRDEHLDPACIEVLEGSRVVALGQAVGPVFELAPKAVVDKMRTPPQVPEARES